MSIDTVTEKSQLRTSFGLGSTDTVEFAAVETSHFNFPNLTTSELNAVADATEGDTYFDSDRGQFVRFTAAASYGVVTSKTVVKMDSVAANANGLTLATSGLVESGLITQDPIPTSPVTRFYETNSDNINGGQALHSHIYHDGSIDPIAFPAGWYDEQNGFARTDTNPLVPNTNYRVYSGSLPNYVIGFNYALVEETTPVVVLSEQLLAGVSYEITVKLSTIDTAIGNLQIVQTYDGLFASSRLRLESLDRETGFVKSTEGSITPNQIIYAVGEVGQNGIESPLLGVHTFTYRITPSAAGLFTLGLRQNMSDTLPLYLGKATITITQPSD